MPFMAAIDFYCSLPSSCGGWVGGGPGARENPRVRGQGGEYGALRSVAGGEGRGVTGGPGFCRI